MAAFLKYLLYTTSILSSIVLIAVIMVQQTKSGGGLGAVQGGVTESMFGTSAGNVLTKITTWTAVVFLVSTLLLGTVIGRLDKTNKSVSESLLETMATENVEAPTPAPTPTPATPTEEAK